MVKVILKREVDNLGLAGDVVDVADGYGRNYLIPRGLAIKATKGSLKEAETLTRARKAREAATVDEAAEFKEVLESRTLRVEARVDEKGTLYGSVGAGDVQQILKQRGHDIDRRRIDLQRPIKAIGTYEVEIHVHPQVTAQVPVEIVDVEGEVTVEGLEAASKTRTEAEELAALEEAALEAAEEIEAEEAAAEAEAAEDEAAEDEAGPDEPPAADAAPEEPAAAVEHDDDEAADEPAGEPDEGGLAAHASAPSDIAAPKTPEEILADREGSDDDGTEEPAD